MNGITPAAAVVLVRPADDAVFLVQRSERLRFMPGFVAFPGGKVDACDGDAVAACAARELFEETGVLLGAPAGDYAEERRAVLANERPLRGVAAETLRYAGRLVTPPFSPTRFDTSFFVATLPPDQDAEVWPGELESGGWWRIADALEAWERGELLLSPPTFSILERLGDAPGETWAEILKPMLAAIQEQAIPPIWFSPGVRMIPLDASGLPPTRYTNAYVLGTGPRILVDPGPVDPAEQEALMASVGPGEVQAILLTHHHPDHIGAVNRLREEYGLPVWAHPEAAERLVGQVRVDRFIEDGTVLSVGGLELHVMLTPGHAPGHLALWEPRLRLLFAADLVSPLSSLIIDPEDGDLETYVHSLNRVRELPIRLLLPSHGPPTTRATHLIDQTLKHRAIREEQLMAAWAAGLRDLRELALELYRGSPEQTLRLAERQIESGLIKLRREGRI